MTRRIEHDVNGEFADYIESEHEDHSALEGDLDDQLSAITSELGSNDEDVEYSMMVYKVVPNTGNMEYLFTVFPHELPILDRLRDEYGGGDFETRVYRKQGGKRKTLFRKLRQKIGAPRVANHVKQGDSGEVTQLARVMMQGFEKMSEMVMEIKREVSTQPVQQAPTMTEMMQSMAMMMSAMKDIAPQPPAQGGNEVKTLLEGLKLGQELASERGDASSTDVLLEAIKSFGPALTEVTKAEVASPKAIPIKQNPTVRKEPMLSPKEIMLRQQIKNLVKCAQQGKDPSLYAELTLDNVPEPMVKEFINGDYKKRVTKLVPEAENVWPWFEKMRDEIHIMLMDDLTPIPDSGNNLDHADGKPDNRNDIEHTPREAGGKGDAGSNVERDKKG